MSFTKFLPVALTVGVLAAIIVLLELTDWFELAFVYFIAYAGYFAYVFGKFSEGAGNAMDMFYFWVPIEMLNSGTSNSD